MNTMRGLILGSALFLASGLSLFALAADEDKATIEAREAINKFATDISSKDWATASKEGAEIAKKHELLDVMLVQKKRDPKARVSGVGIGDKPGKISPDGIEGKIVNMSKVPMSKEILARDAADLIRMAERTAAIAAVGFHQCPVGGRVGKKDPKKWKEWSEDMYRNSQELIAALKKQDPASVKYAAYRLHGTCTECHCDFK